MKASSRLVGLLAALMLTAPAVAQPALSLQLAPGSECVQPGETVTVELHMSGLGALEAAGFQAFLGFDTARLTFISGSYTPAPFGMPILTPITAVGGEINLAAGIDQPGQMPSSADALLVILTFEAQDVEDCDGTMVIFRPFVLPSRLTDINGQELPGVMLVDSPPVVFDGIDPMLSVPPDTTVECDEPTDPGATGMGTATDNCDDAPVVTFEDIVTPSACPGQYTIFRTWTATDACGNSASAEQTISVDDTTAPQLTVPPDTTIECTDPSGPGANGQATAEDNCDPAPDVSFSDSVQPGSCPQASMIIRTWTATDGCGNSTSAPQVIMVQDTTAPMISVPGDVTVECDEPTDPGATGMGTATDACDPAPSVSFSDSVAPGDCPQEQVITRTWIASDGCGNMSGGQQTITVQDTTAPMLTVPPDVTIPSTQSSDPSNTGQATATDNCDGDPDVSHSDSTMAGDCPQEQIITRTWTATDACGNSVSGEQTIVVLDLSDDCNDNGNPDACDIAEGISQDLNGNGIPDECDEDCNDNGVPDDLDISSGTSEDCNGNGVPDECDIASGTSADCNGNGVPDECDIADGTSDDCNGNGVPDECDIAGGTSEDCNGNGVPDECDIAGGDSDDFNGDGVPDECQLMPSLIIRQGACPAPVNRNGNGIVKMALIGDAGFDVHDVDQSTLRLYRVDAVGTGAEPNDGPPGPGIKFKDLNHPYDGPPPCSCNDNQSSDGIDDLEIPFRTDELVEALELDLLPAETIVPLVLRGNMEGGEPFEAFDCIRVVGNGAPPAMVSVTSGSPGIWVEALPPDTQLDTGGFTTFNRIYPPGTAVILIAPEVQAGQRLIGWKLDGVLVQSGQAPLVIVATVEPQMVEPVYQRLPLLSPLRPVVESTDE